MSTETAALRPTSKQTQPERVEQRPPSVAPFVDVFENANEIWLWADVPGAAKDSVQVHIDKGQLTLAAKRTDGEAPGTPVQTEQRAYDYHRVFTVPTGIDASKIEAELSGGVLKVRLPKSEALKPRRIEVKAS